MIAVGCGAMIGACIRVYLSQFNRQFPYITLFINIIGSLLLGLISQTDMMLFFGTGMMGGLTTFSTFSVESVRLLRSDILIGVIYIVCSAVLPPAAFLTAVLIL